MATPRRLSLLPLLFLAACSREEEARVVFAGSNAALTPAPTEDLLDPEAEERQTPLRKAWFEHRHRAAPDVDWRALERVNGEAEIEKRNRLGFQAVPRVGRWIERGSQNVAGRVHAASLAPDGQSLYVGTALGGVWEGTLDGASWEPFGDNLYGGAHYLMVVSGATGADPDVVLAATSGGLVHVTRDHGISWEIPTGIGSASLVKRVLKSSEGSETVFLLRRAGSTYRLLRSTDRLASFQLVLDLGSFSGDAWIRRDGSPDLYAITSTGVRKSTDLGNSWVSVGPAPAAGAAVLTGSEAGAPRLWSVVGSSLYRSNDAGASWTLVTSLSDYWGELNASITDPDVFLYGGVETHRTLDGGASFSVINTWQAYYGNPAIRLHADIQGIDVVPNAGPFGETWYISTDGGLYRSTDLLASVQNLSLSGLRVSQYYSTHTSQADTDHVVAGAQDQGYQRAALPATPPGTQLDFSQLISGDYGHLTSGDGDHGFLFSVYPGFVLIQKGENNPTLLTEDFPAGEDHAWMPPVVADPLDAQHFFFCASHLVRYTKTAGVNNWTPALWSSFDFGVSAGEYISALTFSPVDPQRAYAVTDRGRLYHSTNRGVSWTQSASTGPGGQYFYGTALLASSSDVNTVWVGGSGYSGPAVYRSTNGGLSFQAHTSGLPPTLVYCLGEAPDGSGTIFCGTETAAYARAPDDANWRDITGTQAPITVYWSVEPLPDRKAMRFGTYGRGIWDYQLAVQAHAALRNGSGMNPECLTSVSPPVIGKDWVVSIDPSLSPGTAEICLVLREAPASGTILRPGELLIGGGLILSARRPASGSPSVFRFPIPNDPSLVGRAAYAQAALLGSQVRFCNALDLVTGY